MRPKDFSNFKTFDFASRQCLAELYNICKHQMYHEELILFN